MKMISLHRALPTSLLAAGALLSTTCGAAGVAAPTAPLNILLLTVDDMNFDSVGAFGSPVPDATPRIDRLSGEGRRFEKAHVNVAVCQPSRACMLTGLYSHRSGVDGFNQMPGPLPTAMSELRKAGYRVGIIGKVDHSTPEAGFMWDFARVGPQPEFGADENRRLFLEGRTPAHYATQATAFFQQCQTLGKPFLLVANITDPHRPFANSEQQRQRWGNVSVPQPSRVYRPEEIVVPDWLPDLPGVRQELAEYYSSVRRADDAVGEVLDALERADLAKSTLVVFLSDNGMALPFSKSNCYLASTRTPLIVRWPGVTAEGSVDDRHFVSTIDICPTILAAAGVPVPPGIDGRSFTPLLRGETQAGREAVFTQYHENSGRQRYPMRAIQTERYLYIYSPWSDGRREMKMESLSGLSWRAMRAAAEVDPQVAARVEFFRHRTLEELYDLRSDPAALVNLITDPAQAGALAALRERLQVWMVDVNDPALEAFAHRTDSEARARFMAAQDAIAATRPRPTSE